MQVSQQSDSNHFNWHFRATPTTVELAGASRTMSRSGYQSVEWRNIPMLRTFLKNVYYVDTEFMQ